MANLPVTLSSSILSVDSLEQVIEDNAAKTGVTQGTALGSRSESASSSEVSISVAAAFPKSDASANADIFLATRKRVYAIVGG
jgi:hypothetical protein